MKTSCFGVNFETNHVLAPTMPEAWRDVMWLCVRNGYDYIVKQGSYVGQIRRQLPYVTIVIHEPWQRPLAPIMPEGSSISPPASEESIQDYFSGYLMNDEKQLKEQYTYGGYIVLQLPRIIELLKGSEGATNQACITIGNAESVKLSDPPCLKVVSFKVVDGRLAMTVYFRSWDLFCGLPVNLGGLQWLKEYVLQELQSAPSLKNLKDGELIAFSDGLHIYEQYFSLVDQLNVDKISITQ